MRKKLFLALAIAWLLSIVPGPALASEVIDTGTTCWMLTSTMLVLLIKKNTLFPDSVWKVPNFYTAICKNLTGQC